MKIEIYDVDLIILKDDNDVLLTFNNALDMANENNKLIKFQDEGGKRPSIIIDARRENEKNNNR